jgi:SAM-dependent methyltransferase
MKLPSISKLPYCIKHLPGYDRRNWLRVAQIDAWTEFLEPLKECSVLEISPSWNSYWRSLGFRSYEAVSYPEFDICRQALERQFDIVIADQVLEHVPASVEAVRSIRRMTRHHALIATPFLFRVHGRPGDFCRWTDAGLRQLMADGGFDSVTVSSWGNKACARAHIGGPVRDYGFWRDMRNDPEYPMMVWAIGEV